MTRRLFNFLTALSLLMFVGATAMWVRSHRVYDRVQLTVGDRYMAATSTCGFVTVFSTAVGPDDAQRSRRWSFYRQETRDFGRSLFTTDWKRQHAVVRLPGFEFRTFPTFSEVAATWPLIMLSASALPGIAFARRIIRHSWQRLRRRAGRCAVCGYDLRATPGRCPECGTTS